MGDRDPAIEHFLFPRLTVSLFLDESRYREEILGLVDEGVGGFICFDGEISECAGVISEIRRRAERDLLFAADCEFGTAMRFSGGTAFPPMMGLAVAGDEVVNDVARAIGREMSAAGLDWNLAPVLDINTNRSNPIVNVRSFGEEAATVGRAGAAYVAGLRSTGILTCGKHLPGHGDTSIDSHIGLPTLQHDLHRLESIELAPFAGAISAGVDSLMSAHLLVPALGAVDEPVSLSAAAIARLRSILRFNGPMITDALDMGALDGVVQGGGDIVTQAFIAGNDVLEIPGDPFASLEALRQGVSTGLIPAARIVESYSRLERLYERRNAERQDSGSGDALETVLAENRGIAREASRQAIRSVGERVPDPSQTGSWYLFCGPMDREQAATLVGSLPGIEGLERVHLCDESAVRIRRGEPELPPVLIFCFSPRGGAGTIGVDPAGCGIPGILDGDAPWVITLGNPYLPESVRPRGQHDLFGISSATSDLLAEIVTGRYHPDAR